MIGPAATAERDTLLATKLNVPVSRPDLVQRPRLAKRLDEGLSQGVVLVCAPAGYGKTVLLADWARHVRFPVAWLSLDAGDNDPARFWRHAVAALDRARPGIGARVGSVLGPPTPPSFDGLVTALINELTAQPDSDGQVLVLDDCHVVGSRSVHTSLGFLLERRPTGLRVVLASRAEPPLPLARLRARGQLAEVRAADLRFTVSEAAALLTPVAGSQLPEAAVAALAARTEGWAAGLQLAGLQLAGLQLAGLSPGSQPDVAGFVAGFTGSNRYVLDFLTEEVLEQQHERVRTFLLETSVLERLSGDLCDAVTGRPGSQALLEHMERAGLFLVPLDEVRGWWRYHHLFADLLRGQLLEHQPAQVGRLHRCAASWCQQHGMADDAIAHAVAAGELTWAAQLIEQHFDAVYFLRGEADTMRRWLTALPADLVQSRPRLLLAQAAMAATGGRPAAAEPLLDQAERAPDNADEEPFEPSVGRADSVLTNVPALIAVLRCYLAQVYGDAEAAARYASQAEAELSGDERQLSSLIEGSGAVTEWLRGRLAEAERRAVSVLAERQVAGLTTMATWAAYILAHIQRAQGCLNTAARTAHDMLEVAVPPSRPPLPAAGAGYVAVAELARERNELDTALEQVIEGITLCRLFVYATPLATGLATLAWIRQATGDPAGALAAMDEALQAAPGPPGPLNPIPAQRARLLLAQGDLAAATRWVKDCGLDADDAPDYSREQGHLVLARVLLAHDLPGQALKLLDRLHAAAIAEDRGGSIVEIAAQRALAQAACGDQAGALDALAEVLMLACPQGYVRVFADEGPPMAALLGKLIAQRTVRAAAAVPLDYLARLQRAFGAQRSAPAPGQGAAAAVSVLAEQLTGRELEVLKMLAAGRSNQAIAAGLLVSLDTVKKHVSHLLAKLGAATRTEAVARARELSLIP
jgi:LuxR family transcriptional regulator, maltose regulon positive regulatory protein